MSGRFPPIHQGQSSALDIFIIDTIEALRALQCNDIMMMSLSIYVFNSIY